MWEFLVEVYFFVGILLRFIFGYNMIQLYYIQGVSICILSMTTDNKRNEPLKFDMELENRLLREEIPFDMLLEAFVMYLHINIINIINIQAKT